MVEQRIITRTVCPAELRLAIPPEPAPAADAIVQGNEAGLGFIARLANWGQLLAARLSDAAAECPEVQALPPGAAQ